MITENKGSNKNRSIWWKVKAFLGHIQFHIPSYTIVGALRHFITCWFTTDFILHSTRADSSSESLIFPVYSTYVYVFVRGRVLLSWGNLLILLWDLWLIWESDVKTRWLAWWEETDKDKNNRTWSKKKKKKAGKRGREVLGKKRRSPFALDGR